jgi:hypothetical protein
MSAVNDEQKGSANPFEKLSTQENISTKLFSTAPKDSSSLEKQGLPNPFSAYLDRLGTQDEKGSRVFSVICYACKNFIFC